MPRLALLNMLIGFAVLSLAAAAGAFVANDITVGYLRDKEILDSWSLLLQKSAHGHTNLFAILHICFGVTFPYSALSRRVKVFQTVGLSLGTFAMGPLMLMRSASGPSDGFDPLAIIIGGSLSCALLALTLHAAGLGLKLLGRS